MEQNQDRGGDRGHRRVWRVTNQPAIGIYGVVSYSASQRRNEIGIRMALGARPEDVVWAVVRRCLLLILLGEVFGVALSATLSKTLATSSMLFEVDHRDASTYVAVALAWLAVGFIACYLPAREATRVDPMAALRNG
ncbi:MAG TPA: FtsX-like permease family protein [Bryobacteraceae bacterium]|nr:FtsX-like permease family protein [Bryobacteraceae bacterium]